MALTPGGASAIGLVTVAGVLGKLTFVALVPGIALALLLLGWRAWPRERRQALRGIGVAAAIVVLPVLAYAVLNTTVWHRGGLTAGGFAGAATATLPTGHTVTLNETLDYIWQLYLPRLPFMHHKEFSYFPLDGDLARWHDRALRLGRLHVSDVGVYGGALRCSLRWRCSRSQRSSACAARSCRG